MSAPTSTYHSSLTVFLATPAASKSHSQAWVADEDFNPFHHIEAQQKDACDLAQARQAELCDKLAATQAEMDKLKTMQRRLAMDDPSQPTVASQMVSEWTRNTLERAAEVVQEKEFQVQTITEQLLLSDYEYERLSQKYIRLQERCEILRQVALDQDDMIERAVGSQPSIQETELQLQILRIKASHTDGLETDIARLRQIERDYQALQKEVDGPNGLRAKASKYDELEKTFGNLNLDRDTTARTKRRSKRLRTASAEGA
ncbi:hypothetical protein K491DRAFT_715866 [Lophiostoma macrostomum CBS 122681]|uniref:Uncharacterized protein n=1 Tax=Lophiostoma macrostomum CBS 122681 TaxID=1314788 RepID=A0A6A6TB95_9PLEO|nr:hypothetical protein K491DRAFT_715866 [Lophiostoma macrostomum CBS 122681]